MVGHVLDRGGPKDSETAPNSFLTKINEKGFWRFATEMYCSALPDRVLLFRFCICNLVLFLVVQAVVSFGYFISCAAPNLQVALALAPTLIIPFMLFGGFFLNAS